MTIPAPLREFVKDCADPFEYHVWAGRRRTLGKVERPYVNCHVIVCPGYTLDLDAIAERLTRYEAVVETAREASQALTRWEDYG